ncbi:iron-sulfur cluster biosynthesis family protein [Paenibacillus sp. NPDC056579]|uniref:iron-sulfur cluster biosynthesis family protein n=1 Tax=unclassified Paenibacillus TaxID=185978 RepID=UPI001EF7EC47|nr:iron-sulfur cluster biosynthesis family protein [Paenibacillus sp. H1-7]ULL15685.1 hypothetical protein DVH26_15260 [Paenibacillus sp. H1-7]
MHITFTEQATEQLHKQTLNGNEELKLAFDSEGCGCSVSGVPTLWIVSGAGERDLRASGEPFSLLYDKKDEIFFEDRMTLDYRSGSGYVLKSSGQIYNANMRLVDKRG